MAKGIKDRVRIQRIHSEPGVPANARLRGWARVDFRVDGSGRPCILEVNANPCLSPDAGFAAGLERAGIAYPDAIARIVGSAIG